MKLHRLLSLFRSGWQLGLMLLLPAVLVACGGSGAGANGGGASAASIGGLANTGNGSAQVQLTSDKVVLNSNKSTPIQLTAFVIDGNGVVVPNRPITWQVQDSVSPSGVRLEGSTSKTDAAGKTTASLVLSGDQSNRTVKVTVTSSDIQSSMDISVAGTSVAISGPQTVPLNGAASKFTLTLKDSSGIGIASRDLSIASRAGNNLSKTTVTTDQSGQATVDLIGTVGGDDVLTVSGLGANSVFNISVASEALQVIPTIADIAIGTTSSVTVSYAKSGGIPPGTAVTLTSTRGTVTPGSADISSGSATFQVSSNNAGPVTFAATVGTTQGVASARFIAVTPAAIDLQATPSIIGPNQSGQTAERSTLIAVVRDASGNPVKGKIIAFTNSVDPSGGRIDPPTSITDDGGQASSTFIAGSTSTSPNGVRLQATVVGTSLTSEALVSVSRAELFVRIGQGGKIASRDQPPTYTDRLAVVVSDSTGNPVPNATVQVRLTPLQFATGQMCRFKLTTNACDAEGTLYSYNRPAIYPPFSIRPSEDSSPQGRRDGVCQSGEDSNGDGQLTPGNVATASVSSVTGTDGVGNIDVVYPKQFAYWVQVVLEVTIKVGGSEGAASSTFWLAAPADDVANVAVTPAWFSSPFFPPNPAPIGFPDYPVSESPTCPP